MKLAELLANIEELADNLEPVPEEVIKEIYESIKSNVDFWFEKLNYIEALAETNHKIAEKYCVKAKNLEAKHKFFKGLLAETLERFGWLELKGREHTLKLVKQKRFSILQGPTKALTLEAPDLVNVEQEIKLSWKLDKLKEVFLANPELYKDFAGYKEIKYIKF